MSVNKMILIGNLGGDPETRDAGGNQVTNFNIATNEKWKDKNGQDQERVEWTSIVVWGKLGEICAKYLKKGRQVYVEGRKQTRTWDKDGVTHYKTECIAYEVVFLGGGGDRDDNDHAPSGRKENKPPRGGPPPSSGPDDDIPF
jgi:single-strand DNA-binding protein